MCVCVRRSTCPVHIHDVDIVMPLNEINSETKRTGWQRDGSFNDVIERASTGDQMCAFAIVGVIALPIDAGVKSNAVSLYFISGSIREFSAFICFTTDWTMSNARVTRLCVCASVHRKEILHSMPVAMTQFDRNADGVRRRNFVVYENCDQNKKLRFLLSHSSSTDISP